MHRWNGSPETDETMGDYVSARWELDVHGQYISSDNIEACKRANEEHKSLFDALRYAATVQFCTEFNVAAIRKSPLQLIKEYRSSPEAFEARDSEGNSPKDLACRYHWNLINILRL